MNKKELMKMVGNHKEIVNQYLEGKVSEEELKNTIGLYQTYIVNTYKGQFSCQGNRTYTAYYRINGRWQ